MLDGGQSEAKPGTQIGSAVDSGAGSLYRVLSSPYFRHELRRPGRARQRLDPVGDPLRRFTELRHSPVGRVAFGDVIGPGVVGGLIVAGTDGRNPKFEVGRTIS